MKLSGVVALGLATVLAAPSLALADDATEYCRTATQVTRPDPNKRPPRRWLREAAEAFKRCGFLKIERAYGRKLVEEVYEAADRLITLDEPVPHEDDDSSPPLWSRNYFKIVGSSRWDVVLPARTPFNQSDVLRPLYLDGVVQEVLHMDRDDRASDTSYYSKRTGEEGDELREQVRTLEEWKYVARPDEQLETIEDLKNPELEMHHFLGMNRAILSYIDKDKPGSPGERKDNFRLQVQHHVQLSPNEMRIKVCPAAHISVPYSDDFFHIKRKGPQVEETWDEDVRTCTEGTDDPRYAHHIVTLNQGDAILMHGRLPRTYMETDGFAVENVMMTTYYHKCFLFLGDGRPPQSEDQSFPCRTYATDDYWDDFMKGQYRAWHHDAAVKQEDPGPDDRTWFNMMRFREAFMAAGGLAEERAAAKPKKVAAAGDAADAAAGEAAAGDNAEAAPSDEL